jgi:hypothetical protein
MTGVRAVSLVLSRAVGIFFYGCSGYRKLFRKSCPAAFDASLLCRTIYWNLACFLRVK